MQPYVIRQGDYLAKLAYKFGFDADEVWNDPSNADLRALRSDPNVLWPTDVLYIPDANTAPPTSLVLGSTNTFVADIPTAKITVQFSEPGYASQAYTVQELEDLTGLSTDDSGVATFSVPVTLGTATIVFTESGATFECNVGDLDPINTLSGVFQRLQHLGFIDAAMSLEAATLGLVRSALAAFKAAQSSDSSPADSTPPDSDSDDASSPDSSPPAGDPSGASEPSVSDCHDWPPPPAPPSSPDVATTDSDSDGPPSSADSAPPSSADDPSPESDPDPPSSDPPPSSDDDSDSDSDSDDAGLSDDGTLDDETAQLLVQAHLS